ncbi:nitroreductase family protein [Candidatus Micrarchaeota archaeon]|nr:nitroreductase family protein [Candidatus Micrarchaeota archaeon]
MRTSNYGIKDIILNRWSPRAMSGENIPDDEMMALFEAAGWAPSSYNGQPWRFVYAKRDSGSWNGFFSLMSEFNQSWTKNAAVLVIVVSKKTFDRNSKPSRTHAFDSGAAWENLALEASGRGLVAHAMEGFDYERAAKIINLPSEHEIHCMVAVGKPGKKDDLPEKLREKEEMSGRRPLEEIVIEGKFR